MPIKKRHIILLCCAALLLAAGCRSHREVAQTAPPPPNESAVTPAANQHDTPAAPRPRCANFTCNVQGMQANGQLRIQPDSLIWVCATKLVELGRAELTPDSVLIYSRIVGRSFRGSYEDIYRRFHYRTSFNEVQALLTSADVDREIAALLKRLHIDAAVHIGSWKEVDKISFPFNIPANTRSL